MLSSLKPKITLVTAGGGSAEQPKAKRQVLDKLVPLVQSGAIKTR